MSYLMNRILNGFSSTATAVFGVYFKLQSFFFMPVFGLNNGLIPVLAYNYGARKKDRIDEALKFSLKLAFTIMVCGMLVFLLFPQQLLSLFNASDNMGEMGVVALRTVSSAFPHRSDGDRAGVGLPGIFQKFLFDDHLSGAPADRSDPCRLADRPCDGRCQHGVVELPDRRDRIRCPLCRHCSSGRSIVKWWTHCK